VARLRILNTSFYFELTNEPNKLEVTLGLGPFVNCKENEVFLILSLDLSQKKENTALSSSGHIQTHTYSAGIKFQLETFLIL
jgi:hypothetical protein